MRSGTSLWARAAALAAFAFTLGVGCSRSKEPTDADVVQAAIGRAVAERCNVVTPSIGVDSKTANRDGSWTYTLRYQCAGLTAGSARREMTLRLSRTRDAAGHTAWAAIE